MKTFIFVLITWVSSISMLAHANETDVGITTQQVDCRYTSCRSYPESWNSEFENLGLTYTMGMYTAVYKKIGTPYICIPVTDIKEPFSIKIGKVILAFSSGETTESEHCPPGSVSYDASVYGEIYDPRQISLMQQWGKSGDELLRMIGNDRFNDKIPNNVKRELGERHIH